MVVGNDDWPTEVSEEKDKVAVEVEANEINIPINNQAEEEDIEDEHNEDEENNGGEDYEDHEDQDEVTIPTLSRLSVPPLAGSGKAAVNKAMPEEANSNDATDDCDTTSELDPHSSRTNDNSNLSEYDNGFDEAMHLSLRSKNSLVSEIEISELLEVAESVRRDYHASTWEYLKIATTLLAFIRATGGGQDHEKSSSVSAGLTQLVKVFYPYLVNQPREKLSDNWDSVKREFAAMEMNIDYLYFLLDPMCKTLLLAVNLCGSSKKDADGDDVYPKITVICDRDDILRSTVDYISLHHFSGMKALANFSLFPFFKSTFGEKLVDGVRVEEGEGKGPLKEWFGLVGMELASKWKRVSIPTISSVPDLNEVTVSGNAITIPAASGNAGGICAGFQLEWEGSDEVVIRRVVNKYVGDGSYLLDRSVPSHSFSVSQLRASQPIAAFFEYVQGSESFWLNENTCDSPENRKTLDFVGWFFACAFTHFCSIQLKIHPLLFRMLLDSSYCVTPEDLRLFNPPLFKSLNEMKDMKPSDFAEYLKFEGADEGLSVEKYIDEVVAEKFGPESSVGWQLDAIRQGFSRVIPVEQVGRVGMTGEDLASVIYGDSSDRGGEEFTVSTVFRIAADPDFTSCRPLSKAFWQTVNNYEPHMKRKFIKFVTGVDTLPLAGTEFLRIEMPFTAISADDHKKSLGMLPQAHTCDNTLELPHYWKALCWRNQHNEHEADSDLEAELIALLRKKLQDAVEYSCGYGLDGTAEVSGVLVRNSGANDDDQLVNASYDSLGLPALSERSSTADPVPNTTQPSPPEPATEEDSSSHVEDRVLNSPEKPAPVASPRQEESYEDYDWEEEDAEQ
ncbi:hypothetical protein PHYBOEH_011410 [Phytophthora boehmeriae]|uniref:HECT domain-containing protein n=1 Tax=Phytophthora boehmeriae TaxID=109152 RepID=A0A8T1WWM2_9STRA|nr:hypothetical protein PHYBOEH_011410 [Phytophthora boehmeriae]